MIHVQALARKLAAPTETFDVRELLGRHWLRDAMREWVQNSPVVIKLLPVQADRLRRDWFYTHARFTEISPTEIQMAFGEDDRAVVLALLRWLGPGAELLEPPEWREALREELEQMLETYKESHGTM